MKIRVSRQLQGGIYFVAFALSDFTPDELEKMRAFGVPTVQVQTGQPPLRSAIRIGVTQITTNFNPGFANEEEAKAYEQAVLGQVRSAMEALRQRKDDFSSAEEVNI